MRILTIVTLVSLAAIALPSRAQKSQQEGSTIFQEQCVSCHGTDGHAATDMGKKVQAADLTSEAVQRNSDSQLTKILKEGKNKMPSFQDKLDDDEIKAVIAYVRQLGKGK
jgi:cytochrome c oxidase cbb3-type subunit III